MGLHPLYVIINTKEHPIIWLHSNIQEVNVNHVSEYPMISLHSNNKEVMKKKI